MSYATKLMELPNWSSLTGRLPNLIEHEIFEVLGILHIIYCINVTRTSIIIPSTARYLANSSKAARQISKIQNQKSPIFLGFKKFGPKRENVTCFSCVEDHFLRGMTKISLHTE